MVWFIFRSETALAHISVSGVHLFLEVRKFDNVKKRRVLTLNTIRNPSIHSTYEQNSKFLVSKQAMSMSILYLEVLIKVPNLNEGTTFLCFNFMSVLSVLGK